MKKIGTTSTGNLIIEMHPQEYAALTQPKVRVVPASHQKNMVTAMTPSELSAYVIERLKKLMPKKRTSLIRAIETMFQCSGGITQSEIDKLLIALQNRKFISIDQRGIVTYSGH